MFLSNDIISRVAGPQTQLAGGGQPGYSGYYLQHSQPGYHGQLGYHGNPAWPQPGFAAEKKVRMGWKVIDAMFLF